MVIFFSKTFVINKALELVKLKFFGFISSALYYHTAVFAADYNRNIIDYHQILTNGDSVTNSTVVSSGRLTLYSGAKSNGINIESDGIMEVNKNATDKSSIIHTGGIQYVDGFSLNTTIYGEQKISGSVEGTLIKGGYQSVYGSAQAINTTLSNGGVQYVAGIAKDTIIESGQQYIQSGGKGSDTTINNGGIQNVEGGSVTNTTINDGGTQNVTGGSVTNTIINDGGTQNVDGGTATDTTINYGGIQNVNGGIVTNTTINEVGEMYAWGGSVSNTIVNGGYLDVGGSSTIIKNTVVNNGGYVNVLDGKVKNVEVSGQNASLYIGPAGYNMKPVISGAITASDRGYIFLGYGADSSGADITLNSDAFLQLNNAGMCTTDCLYTLNSLALSGGRVFHTNGGWNTLNLSSLSGNGDFYMYTEVASGKGDLLNVTGNATGAFRLFVQDSGVSPTSDDSLLLVKTGGGDAVFTLGNKGGIVELGTWEYRLKENNSGSWLLSPELKPVPQPDP
ncbi:autotransporter outer membrane beta-barrel domain-containing protein, partial [Salmonella enterica]|nr:autotransporter outer membrane beta-barrel domain-containing protein [Salmonella enterica]